MNNNKIKCAFSQDFKDTIAKELKLGLTVDDIMNDVYESLRKTCLEVEEAEAKKKSREKNIEEARKAFIDAAINYGVAAELIEGGETPLSDEEYKHISEKLKMAEQELKPKIDALRTLMEAIIDEENSRDKKSKEVKDDEVTFREFIDSLM